MDSLSRTCTTISCLEDAGIKVGSLKVLMVEMRGVGTKILPPNERGSTRTDNQAQHTTENHMKLYWEWFKKLGFSGVARLVQLQDVDARVLHLAL